jgi:hypothetical protein
MARQYTCSALRRFQRTLVWFRRCCVHIRRVLTDNLMVYRAGLFCRGVSLARSPPLHAPLPAQTNEKAERVIQTRLREWAYLCPVASQPSE